MQLRTLGVIFALGIGTAACGEQVTSLSALASAPASMSASVPAASEAALTGTTEPATEAPEDAVVIEVGPGPNFIPEEVSVPPGTAAFFLDGSNIDEGITHNFVIGNELREPIVMSDFIIAGDTVVFTVSGLEPGTYTFWCSVDEHYAIGMVGTLEVFQA